MRQALFLKACLIAAAVFAAGCSRQAEVAYTDCQIDEGPCVKMIAPGEITAVFDIQPKPVKTMSGLNFSLSLLKGDTPLADADVVVELTMPGMYMAENRIVLRHKGDGRYEGKGVIVRCPSGKRVWKCRVVISDPHTRTPASLSADYTFEVKKW